MGKGCCLPPDTLNELIARIKKVEENQAALEGAINAFITVYAVRRLPEQPEGPDEHRQSGEGP